MRHHQGGTSREGSGRERAAGKVRFGLLLLVSLLLGLLTVSTLLYNEWSRRFPRLEAGAYLGTFTGALGEDREGQAPEEVRFYVERAEGSEEYLFVVDHNPGHAGCGWAACFNSPARRRPG